MFLFTFSEYEDSPALIARLELLLKPVKETEITLRKALESSAFTAVRPLSKEITEPLNYG